jgi:hypothetical protein
VEPVEAVVEVQAPDLVLPPIPTAPGAFPAPATSMNFSYDLIRVDKREVGDLVFTETSVRQAIEYAKSHRSGNGILELCRFEGGIPDDSMLEVIGYVRQLEIENNVLRCYGEMQDNLHWPMPPSRYMPTPYVDMRIVHRSGGFRFVKSFTITEVVLAYQHVTTLALRKYHQRKSLLRVDKSGQRV